MESITAIIESPKGSGHKFDYEPALKCFKLKKILPAGMVFPFDFGFIQDTKGGDGDPLDVIAISEITTFPGCCMDCRVIGVIKARQTERNGETMRNDRFLVVPEVSHLYKEITSIEQLPDIIIEELQSFFKNYNEQAGKKFEVIESAGAKDAYNLIKNHTS
ncbi:inorganic diphosphatase [Mucilaginibacter litoreus]|uniref:inorganic diphosphatase n=1 Tax=Mucilaginibacter litoreus TaxID=1048221 RepID=A0ABW3AMD5_9SPHI